LQPHFTEDSPIELLREDLRLEDERMDRKEIAVQRKLWIRYQFEFPPDLFLDGDSNIVGDSQRDATMTLPRNKVAIEYDPNSSVSSTISLITQDTSLEDEDYDDSSEIITDTIGDYGDGSGLNQKPNNNGRGINLLEPKTDLHATTAEDQEGARLLLNLFSAQ